MSTPVEDIDTAVSALTDAKTTLTSAAPSLADNVLAAILPVLEAAGYTAPAPTPEPNTTTDTTEVPVSTDTPPAS
jgi:hypothetical protein